VLEHAHRGDLVERPVGGQLAVVAQLDRDAPAQAARVDQALHVGVLVAAERDTVGLHAIVLGSVDKQAAPARTDVQEALAAPQHQLAADVVELGLLRLRERHAAIAEVGA
jgi:hypothetical protein